LLRIVRRTVRKRVERISPLTGLPESYVGTVQGANVYLLKLPRLLNIARVERKRQEPSLQIGLNKQTGENKKKEKRLSTMERGCCRCILTCSYTKEESDSRLEVGPIIRVTV